MDIITIFTPLMGAKDMDVVAMRIITYKGILIGLVVAICLLKDRPRKKVKTPKQEFILQPLQFVRKNVYHNGYGIVIYLNMLDDTAAWCGGEVLRTSKSSDKLDPRIKLHTADGIRVARPGDAIIRSDDDHKFYVARNDEWDFKVKI